MLSPTFIRKKLTNAVPKFVNGAAIYPTIETLPGFFYSYTEEIEGMTGTDQFIEHWCYLEHRQISPLPGARKELTPIILSIGWKPWMFNMEPAICDPVAYHVALVKARFERLKAEHQSGPSCKHDH